MILAAMTREAYQSLAARPLRSALTMVGFAIGVGAFVAMVSFASGARRSVVAQFEALGRGTLVVTAGGRAAASEAGAMKLFEAADARALERAVPGLRAAPMGRLQAEVAVGSRRVSTTVLGTTPAFPEIRAWPFEAGGMFEEEDLALGARLCVLGRSVRERLFGEESGVGQRLRLGELDCRVIGVLAARGQTASGQDQDDVLLVPLPLFERRIAGRAGFDRLLLGIGALRAGPGAREAIRPALRAQRRLAAAAPDDFTVKSPDDLVRVADRSASLLQGLLAAIAGVSLVVGGVGIMNILLVSVGERTREIGVRIAIGATAGQVLLQFLVEAMVLSGAGAAAGGLVGAVAAALVGARLGWGCAISFGLVALALLGGVVLGLVFGLYPARRAARLDPVVALRGTT